MDDIRNDKNQDPTKGLDNVDVTELEDKDLEGAAGGGVDSSSSFGISPIDDDKGGNYNCNC